MTARPPLAGRRVVNTRALHQAAELDRLLEAHGATPQSFPCIAIGLPEDVGALDISLQHLIDDRFDWVVFTSANTVEAVASRIEAVGSFETSGRAAREPVKGSPTTSSASERLRDLSPGIQPPATAEQRFKVAVVGPATAEAVARRLAWSVTFLPSTETAAALGEEVPLQSGDRVLLPQSAIAGPALAAILTGRGARVTPVVAYATTTGSGGIDLASSLAAGEVDAICLTSPSTARGLVERLGGSAAMTPVRIACIGPETAAAARDLGLRVDVVPAAHTSRALVEALAASYAGSDAIHED